MGANLYRELAKDFTGTVRDKYPDLVAWGGLREAVQSAVREVGSALTVSQVEEFILNARVQSGARFSQVFIVAEERVFTFDFWAHGVYLASGHTPHLTQMASAIDMWVTSGCSTSQLAAAFTFVAVDPRAEAYERGDEVEAVAVVPEGHRVSTLSAVGGGGLASPGVAGTVSVHQHGQFAFQPLHGLSVHS